MNYTEDVYEKMIDSFRTAQLRVLLVAFRRTKTGRKFELKERAQAMLRNKPVDFNYQEFLIKIDEIYRSMHSLKPYQKPLQYPKQSIHIPQAKLPHIQTDVYGNSQRNIVTRRYNIQYSNQAVGPHNKISQGILKKNVNTVSTDDSIYAMNNANPFIPSTQSLANVTLKKLPFYEVFAEIIKPSTLVGNKRLSVLNNPRGMKEEAFKFTLSCEQATDIAMNRDISNGKNEYVYQLQIRICLFTPDSTELIDYMPLALIIRLGNGDCPLPPINLNTPPGTKTRRMPQPINCTEFVKLNPSIVNTITVNWIPDEKTYIMGMYLVKKLTPDDLLQKLYDKRPRSSEETKYCIIKKMTDFDSDLTTTSYRFSLVCPLGRVRMKIPVKSTKCDHLQCFDASTFILMNEKKPTWMCPTCNQPIFYDDLRLESYFLEVVSNPNLPDNCGEIELLADGTWQVYEEIAVTIKEKLADSINLDDSGDDNSMNVLEVEKKHGHNTQHSKKSENLKVCFIDLTISDDEPPELNYKQENEAQAAEVVLPEPGIDLKPLFLVQPQQSVTSSEPEILTEVNSSSSPPVQVQCPLYFSNIN